jgi:uncharacterized protein YukE
MATDIRTVATPRADQAAKDLIARIGDAQNAIKQLDGALNVLSDTNQWDGTAANNFRSNIKPNFQGSEGPFTKALNDLNGHAAKIKKNIEDIMTTGQEAV